MCIRSLYKNQRSRTKGANSYLPHLALNHSQPGSKALVSMSMSKSVQNYPGFSLALVTSSYSFIISSSVKIRLDW